MADERQASTDDTKHKTSAEGEKTATGGGLTRRSFSRHLFKAVAALWGISFVGVVLSYIKAPGRSKTFEENTQRVGPVAEIGVGDAKFVTHQSEPFWVVRTGNDELVALPATCTHLRCVLKWQKESGRLVCPCHAGAFDLNGNVLGGPPPRPLKPLRVEIKGGIVYVNLS